MSELHAWKEQALAWQAEAKSWQAQAKAWQDLTRQSPQTESHQAKASTPATTPATAPATPTPQRSCLDDDGVSEGAVVRLDWAEGAMTQSGFFISVDGFILTVSIAKTGGKCEATNSFGATFECEHIKEFPCVVKRLEWLNLTLLKAKGVARAPFLSPVPSFSSRPTAVAHVGYERGPVSSFQQREGRERTHLMARAQTFGGIGREDSVDAGIIGAPHAQFRPAGMPGEPVLSLSPGRFVGVVTRSSGYARAGAEFCPVSLDRAVWLKIQEAMLHHREAEQSASSNLWSMVTFT